MTDDPVTPDDAERQAREAEPAADVGREPEVRADEFAAGIDAPVAGSAWQDEIIAELRKPLDPNRVRRRSGRGRESYEYLAGHDVKRRASVIFGFGNWGHRIVEQVEIGAVEVETERDEWEDTPDGGRRKTGAKTTVAGWHVAYRCVVRIWVRADGFVYETEGSGYGDGVEYTPAARLSACELALKESETDALKRAFTDLGDQFGLILYAKDDEKKRIDRDENRGESRSSGRAPHRQADTGPSVPRNWADWERRFSELLGGGERGRAETGVWLRQAVVLRWGVAFEGLKPGEQREALQLAASTLILLEETQGDLAFDSDPRTKVAAAWAARWDGIALDGPAWRLSVAELERPTYEDTQTEAVARESASAA